MRNSCVAAPSSTATHRTLDRSARAANTREASPAMFTGIIEELGSLVALQPGPEESARITVRGPVATSDAKLGDSIAVNGVCLTITVLDADVFEADIMKETLVHTTLGDLRPDEPVNLERAMRADGRFGGHVVSGHVDSVGVVRERIPAANWEVARFSVDRATLSQIVLKGSVAVDGISLTVTAVDDAELCFEVSLIPATLTHTTLGSRPVGAAVNIETDVLGKYVQRMVIGAQP